MNNKQSAAAALLRALDEHLVTNDFGALEVSRRDVGTVTDAIEDMRQSLASSGAVLTAAQKSDLDAAAQSLYVQGSATLAEKLWEIVGGNTSANSAVSPAPTPSAGTIDTDEYEAVLKAYRNSTTDFADKKAALLAYIMDWHSAGVAAARLEGWKAMESAAVNAEAQNADEWKARAEKAETALAAAREQALEEAAKLCDMEALASVLPQKTKAVWQSQVAQRCAEAIRALASQPATTAQTDEVTDSQLLDMAARYFDALGSGKYLFGEADLVSYARRVIAVADRDAPLRGAPAVSDGVERAVARVSAYLSERAKQPRLDQTEITAMHVGDDREAVLSVADLRTLIAAAAPVAQEKPVVQDRDLSLTPAITNLVNKHGSLCEEAPHYHRPYYNFTVKEIHAFAHDVLKLHAAPRAATPPAAPVGLDKLHSAIMNLPCKSSNADLRSGTDSELRAYQVGHRDARHAAAELVAATQAERQPQAAADDLREAVLAWFVGQQPFGIPMDEYIERAESWFVSTAKPLARLAAAIQQSQQQGGA